MTPHFSRRELQCRCGCGRMEIPPGFLNKLEDLRVSFAKPMIVTSGYRCPVHNKDVSTTGSSGPHTLGAVDIAVSGHEAYKLVLLAMTLGFSGIGISQKGPHNRRYVHLDDLPAKGRPRPWIWSY